MSPSSTGIAFVADDYGLTDATCRAIIEAHRGGVVTATSVLAVVPGVEARMGWLDDAPTLAVGAHLALVGEDPPLLSAAEIPTLVDGRGRLAASWRRLLPRLMAGWVDPADVRRELATQLELVSSHRPIGHVDTHQHVHLWPSVGAVVVDLAGSHGAAAVRVPRPSVHGPRSAAMSALADRLERSVRHAGLRSTDRFRGVDEAGRWDLDRLRAAVLGLAQGEGTVEVNTHPGPREDAARSRYRWGYRWADELDALCAPELRHDLDRLGFSLAPPGAL